MKEQKTKVTMIQATIQHHNGVEEVEDFEKILRMEDGRQSIRVFWKPENVANGYTMRQSNGLVFEEYAGATITSVTRGEDEDQDSFMIA